MPTMPVLEDNLKKKKKAIKIDLSNLPPPHITAHNENGVVGDGVKKKRGRPKKANPEKLLKDLEKRLKKEKKEKEKEPKKDKVEIPSSYQPSTQPTIKMEMPKPKTKPEKPKTVRRPKTPKTESGETTPRNPHQPAHFAHTPPVGRAKKGLSMEDLASVSRRADFEEQERKDAERRIADAIAEGKKTRLKKHKTPPLPKSPEMAESKKAEPKPESPESPSPKKSPSPRTIKSPEVAEPKESKEETEAKEEKHPVGFWAGKEPPYKNHPRRQGHSEEFIEWCRDNPTSEQAKTFFKSVRGKEYLEANPHLKPPPAPRGRPKKEAPAAQTPEVKAYVERHKKQSAKEEPSASIMNMFRAPRPPPSSPPSVEAQIAHATQTPAERKEASKKGVAKAANLFRGKPITPLPAIAEPPSREIPVKEDAKATVVAAETEPKKGGRWMTEEEKDAFFAKPPRERELILELERLKRSDSLEDLEKKMEMRRELKALQTPKTEGSGIDFSHIKWGSLTSQMKQHPEMKSLEEFSNHILSNPNKFHKRTVKRANFYKNVIEGKGLDDSSGDESSSSEEEEEIISHHNIMMSRPVGLHPALESSTMTMNPGAYNNIKPLMGHLLCGGTSSHIRRTEGCGGTISHYGDHAMEPQMMPQGKYVKHPAMKGVAVEPTTDDLIQQGVHHLSGKFGIAPEQAHELLHTALHKGMDAVPKELHPFANQGLEMGKHLLSKQMGGHIGGSFFGDIGHAFKGLGHDIKHGFKRDIIHPAEEGFKRDIIDPTKKAMPEVVHKLSKFANNPYVQGTMAGLSYLAGPEVGIPMSVAYFADRNALDMAKSGRNLTQQINRRYIRPANQVLGAANIGHINDIKGGKIGTNLGKVLASDLGYLADAGANKLVDMMGHPSTEHHRTLHGGSPFAQPSYARGGKVGKNLGKILASDLGYLADAGANKLVDMMGHPSTEHHRSLHGGSPFAEPSGGEIGDGVKKKFAKGSQEAKDHMAKLRAMRGKGVKKEKKMKGGAMPPPSRSPITDPEISGGSFMA